MIWNTAQYYPEPKAAIVSEGMGTGKTCICLALVLAFKHQLANIDQVRGDSFGRISSRRTARSEAFPWVAHRNIENEEDLATSLMVGNNDGHGMLVDGNRTFNTVPRLYDLTLDLILCSTHFRALHLHERDAFIPTNEDLPYVWEIPLPKGRDDTRSTSSIRRKVYISATSLIIVPDILVAQWLAELNKHVKEGALDYIKLEKDDIVPNEEELAKLDLVIVSETKIRLEESRFWTAGESTPNDEKGSILCCEHPSNSSAFCSTYNLSMSIYREHTRNSLQSEHSTLFRQHTSGPKS